MRCAFVADVHCANHKAHGGPIVAGLNDRCRAILKVLGEAARVAAKEDAHIVVLGDLFDTTRPEPQIIAAVHSNLAGAVLGTENRVGVLLGNHERCSAEEGDHALGPLDPVYESPKEIGVWDRPGAFCGEEEFVVMVPFQEGPAREWLRGAVEEALSNGDGECVALALHLGLRDEQLCRENPWAAQADDAVDVKWLAELCHELKIPRVYAGNWHGWSEWEFEWDDGFRCILTQVGALVPTGFCDGGF
jgi:hypothetical protein